MTDERKQYLASISKEERIIRRKIRQLKGAISDDKYALNNGTCMKRLRKICIRENKIIIKALKKQLPAPMKEQMYYCVKVVNCPICDSALDTWAENYCWQCGQKLR